MCTPKQPKAQTPAAAPAPPADPPSAPVVNEAAASEKTLLNAKRTGRKSFRIDRANTGPTGGSGLSIPTA